MGTIQGPIQPGEPSGLGGSAVIITIGGEDVALRTPATLAFVNPKDGEVLPIFKNYIFQVAASPDTIRLRLYLNNILVKATNGDVLSYRWFPEFAGDYEAKAIAITSEMQGTVAIKVSVA